MKPHDIFATAKDIHNAGDKHKKYESDPVNRVHPAFRTIYKTMRGDFINECGLPFARDERVRPGMEQPRG